MDLAVKVKELIRRSLINMVIADYIFGFSI